MFEADPVTIASVANDAARMAMQAGPPADLPAGVPDFVTRVLGEIGASAADTAGGLGEAISSLTPGGSEAADSAAAAAGNTPGR